MVKMRAKMAAGLAFKLVICLLFFNFWNQYLAFRLFQSTAKSNSYKDCYGLYADGSISAIYELIFIRQHVCIHRTKYESKFKVAFSAMKQSKRGFMCLALPSKPFKIDLTIYVDVS